MTNEGKLFSLYRKPHIAAALAGLRDLEKGQDSVSNEIAVPHRGWLTLPSSINQSQDDDKIR